MKRIEEIDRNFAQVTNEAQSFAYFDPQESPFAIYGLTPNSQRSYCRLPLDFLPQCSEGVQSLAYHLAGGCIRFATDSTLLQVEWTLRSTETSGHFTPCARSGMELFEETECGSRQIKTLIPAMQDGHGCKADQRVQIELPRGLHNYALYLPLYNGVRALRIGVVPGSQILPGHTPRLLKPVVFYGSSITQGGCAAKVGSCYTSLLARRLDAAQVNLGFSGCAKGELSMANYISSLDMSALVLDYDHNAPNAEYLKHTHETFFRAIRKKQPKLPILLLSRPDIKTDEDLICRDIIRTTYQRALEDGDAYVDFVDGSTMFGTQERELCTVDGSHPTSLGFLRMADAIEPALRKLLKINT